MAVTMITVIALTTVFMVYAALLATYTGGNVVVNYPGAQIQYNKSNTSNSTWESSLTLFNGTAWYARINITNSGAQTVTLQWRLVKDGTPQPIQITSDTITLTAGDNTLYATASGQFSGNYNWGQNTTTSGTYQIRVLVNG